ncbi:VanZ family protein [Microbacterium sp. NPDC087591]|uniref:VanZ family protein n=1 Tax=Microbacterium sp. NPDC087591 TaxID=3364192 RepID=UPI0037FB76DA
MPAPRTSTLEMLARTLLVPYALGVALIVWLPASIAGRVTGLAFRLARFVSDNFGIALSTSYTVFEFLANIALFVPFGLLLAAAWPRTSPWLIILIGYASSATIELVQTLLPSRYPTISDVIANTLGTVIGCLAVHAVLTMSVAGRRLRTSTVEA